MNRSVICGLAGLAMVVAMGLSTVDSTATAQAGCGGLFARKACGGLFHRNACGGCEGVVAKKACCGGLLARLKARRAAKKCCAPVDCCTPAPATCCTPAPATCCTPAPATCCTPAPAPCCTVEVVEEVESASDATNEAPPEAEAAAPAEEA